MHRASEHQYVVSGEYIHTLQVHTTAACVTNVTIWKVGQHLALQHTRAMHIEAFIKHDALKEHANHRHARQTHTLPKIQCYNRQFHFGDQKIKHAMKAHQNMTAFLRRGKATLCPFSCPTVPFTIDVSSHCSSPNQFKVLP